MRKEKNPPAYLQVARDIAGRIASGEIKEGERFSGRSLMSSQYNVSPETIRRALGLLAEMDVLSMRQNVGAVVKSRQQAALYMEQSGEAAGLRLLREELSKLMEERRALDERIESTTLRLADMAERFRYSDEMQTYEFQVPQGACIAGKTIAESAFRTETGATILAIRRGSAVELSPGPGESIAAGDVLVVVCGVLVVPVVSEFIGRTI
jgi:K+/H+ antiporter YhaU regulatory subunit KhtT